MSNKWMNAAGSDAKSTRWAFTAYEGQWNLFKTFPAGVVEWGWQEELCPDTDRRHYQGYLRLAQQQRLAWLRNVLPGVHFGIAISWPALVNYCKKSETAVPGTQVHQTNTVVNHYTYAQQVADEILKTSWADYETWDTSTALAVVDSVVKSDISKGILAASWIASNPAWKAMWKPYWKEYLKGRQTDRQTEKDDKLNNVLVEYNNDASTQDWPQTTQRTLYEDAQAPAEEGSGGVNSLDQGDQEGS